MKNQGIKNEYNFISKLNKKKINELDFLLQEIVIHLFPSIDKNSMIRCYKNVEYEKGDIIIDIGYIKKYVSIKMGHKNSVHCESIEKFKKFLKEINITDYTIKEILRYLYADGTINGTGDYRQSSIEYKQNNEESIKAINNELNSNANIEKIVDRFIIQGTQHHCHKIDLLVYGTPEDFFYITRQEIYEYIKSKMNTTSSALHFSCLTLQPLSRVLDYNEKMEYMRHWIQIKWYNLEDNIIELMNQRCIN